MRKHDANDTRVLAIDPQHRGFGYAVFEGSDTLIDWGTAHVQDPKFAGTIARIADLCERYDVEMIVIEECAVTGSRRCARVKRLLAGIQRWASGERLRVRSFSRGDVRRALGVPTKEEIAAVAAARYPELVPSLPPERKCWMSEDLRMSVFDAASLALTLFACQKREGGTKCGVAGSVK